MNAVKIAQNICDAAKNAEGTDYILPSEILLARALLKAVGGLSKASHLCFMREDDNTQTIDDIEVITNKTLAELGVSDERSKSNLRGVRVGNGNHSSPKPPPRH
uniref:Uncharacterized protein n=1 Tax=viral metagenome TaxID=1070528 RepID=A0A6H2A425_9ZZZZ